MMQSSGETRREIMNLCLNGGRPGEGRDPHRGLFLWHAVADDLREKAGSIETAYSPARSGAPPPADAPAASALRQHKSLSKSVYARRGSITRPNDEEHHHLLRRDRERDQREHFEHSEAVSLHAEDAQDPPVPGRVL